MKLIPVGELEKWFNKEIKEYIRVKSDGSEYIIKRLKHNLLRQLPIVDIDEILDGLKVNLNIDMDIKSLWQSNAHNSALEAVCKAIKDKVSR